MITGHPIYLFFCLILNCFVSAATRQFSFPHPSLLGRCLLDAPGSLLLVQAEMLPRWKSALQDFVKILCIPNHKKMRLGWEMKSILSFPLERTSFVFLFKVFGLSTHAIDFSETGRSLTVADIVAAQLILAPVQIFSSEGGSEAQRKQSHKLGVIFPFEDSICARSLKTLIIWAPKKDFGSVCPVNSPQVVRVYACIFLKSGYQRHFDALSKPGLEVWDVPEMEFRSMEKALGAEDAEDVCRDFSCGDVVELHSLVALEMNGRVGRLLEWQEASGRWSCLLQPKKLLRAEKQKQKHHLVNVKPCNLRKSIKRTTRAVKRRSAPEPPKVPHPVARVTVCDIFGIYPSREYPAPTFGGSNCMTHHIRLISMTHFF